MDKTERKLQLVNQLADILKEFSELEPDGREKFMIASITQAIGWSPEMYVDMGFPKETEPPIAY